MRFEQVVTRAQQSIGASAINDEKPVDLAQILQFSDSARKPFFLLLLVFCDCIDAHQFGLNVKREQIAE